MPYLDTRLFQFRAANWFTIAVFLILMTPVFTIAQEETVAPVEEVQTFEEVQPDVGDDVYDSNSYDEDEPVQTVNYRSSENTYTVRQVEQRPISEEAWKKALENLDYSSDVPEPPRREREETNRNNRSSNTNVPPSSSGSPTMPDVNTAFWGPVFKALAIILLLGLIVFIAFRLMREPKNTAIARDGTAITIHNLEDYIHETDLDRFLKAALAENNYAQAVRVYFLQIIKDLSARKHIIWSREKTNRTYLREMSSHPASGQFQDATYTYERVWYGNAPIGATEYAVIEQQMRRMLQVI